MADPQPDPDATQKIQLPAEAKVRGLASGQRLFGRYTLEAEVGRGGMGVVWRARDEEFGQTVALKLLPELVARDPVSMHEMKKEAWEARQLRHPNIVGVYEFLRDDTRAAIAMEFVDGPPLSQRRLQQPGAVFSPAALAPLIRQLCAALDYAHTGAKIAHRDLKPANILVTAAGIVKIADFGIARSLSETHTRLTSSTAGTSGTLLYMSPQQLLGQKAAATDDIYALGATLFELLAGRPPFFTGDITHQIIHVPPPSLSARRGESAPTGSEPVPPAWEKAILACLAKESASRPQSIREIAAAFEDPEKTVVVSPGWTAPAPAPAAPPVAPPLLAKKTRPPAAPSSRAWIWAVPLLALGLALAAGWYFGRRLQEPAKTEPARTEPAREIARPTTPTLLPAEPRPEPARATAPAETPPQQVTGAVVANGGLIITTNPPGADLAIGAFAVEKSPVTLKDVKPGRYPVIVRLPGYDDQRHEVEVKENEFTMLDVTLARPVGALAVTSSPPGLEVFVRSTDPADRGRSVTTPVKLEGLAPGDYEITFRRPGWPEQRRRVTVARNQTVAAQADFAGGSLEVASTPTGAEVWSQGRRLGTAPLRLEEIAPGPASLEFRLKGHQTATWSGEVRARETARASVSLEKVRGSQVGQPWTVPGLNLTLAPMAPGTFTMGSEGAFADEQPLTRVTISKPFWLGQTEVTQAQWRAVMGTNPATFKGDDLPVETVSWLEAEEFCRKLTERERAADRLPAGYVYALPTEAQWEYACRAGTATAYSLGDSLDATQANFDGNFPHGGAVKGEYRRKTVRAGSFPANPWGLHDMHGNVREWCADWLDIYPGGAVTDPMGGANGVNRVIRGGSWYESGANCRSSFRQGGMIGLRFHDLGFRVALRPAK